MQENEIKDLRALLAEQRTDLAIERTHLANERTFSAWIRTGITGVAGGFAIHRFVTLLNIQHQRVLHIVAQLLMLWGIAVFLFAYNGYQKSCKKLYKEGKEPKYNCGAAAVTFSIVALSLALFVVTLIASS